MNKGILLGSNFHGFLKSTELYTHKSFFSKTISLK